MNQQGMDSLPPPIASSKPSLPIARSAGTPYERPERARTSHACEPCRERKTKCDGERPSCRRCLHTGTGCHYGYGKGWRKRKTAEDLTATSRRLARYEALLNEIMPHVPPNVKAMIEEAREQDAAASNSGGSETNEPMDTPRNIPNLHHEASTGSSGNPRVSLPLPVPTSLGGQVSGPLPPPLARPFDSSMSPSSNMPRPNSGASNEENSLARLPSITPHGLLIEPSGEAPPAMLPQIKSEPALYSRSGAGSSPPGGTKMHLDEATRHQSAPTG